MIFMIPKVNLGVREMGFLFCNLHICLITLCREINLTYLPCMTLVLPGDTSDSLNSS